MMKSLSAYSVGYGKRSNFPGAIGKTTSYSGYTTKLLDQETSGCFFIHNGTAYAIQAGDAISKEVLVIDPQTGLLNTPEYQTTYLNVDMLFEPSVTMAQLVNLQSTTASNYSTNRYSYDTLLKTQCNRYLIRVIDEAAAHIRAA